MHPGILHARMPLGPDIVVEKIATIRNTYLPAYIFSYHPLPMRLVPVLSSYPAGIPGNQVTVRGPIH